MDAARMLEIAVIEGLNAQADAIHTRRAILLELLDRKRSGIRLETDFGCALRQRSEDFFDQAAVDNGGRAAAEENRFRLGGIFRQPDLAD